MANNIKTIIHIDKENLITLKEKYFDFGEFDFEKVIPTDKTNGSRNIKWDIPSNSYWGNQTKLSEDEYEIVFYTAWRHPFNIFKKIAEDNPEMSMLVSYISEDIGNYCGRYFIKNSKFENHHYDKEDMDVTQKINWFNWAHDNFFADGEGYTVEEKEEIIENIKNNHVG